MSFLILFFYYYFFKQCNAWCLQFIPPSPLHSPFPCSLPWEADLHGLSQQGYFWLLVGLTDGPLEQDVRRER